MVYSESANYEDRTLKITAYAYDGFGRRTLTQSVTGQALRTLYDGRSFEVIREGETFRSGTLTTQFSSSVTAMAGAADSGELKAVAWVTITMCVYSKEKV